MDTPIRKIEDITAEQNRAAQPAAPSDKGLTVEVKGCVRYPGKIQHDDDSAVKAAPAPKP